MLCDSLTGISGMRFLVSRHRFFLRCPILYFLGGSRLMFLLLLQALLHFGFLLGPLLSQRLVAFDHALTTQKQIGLNLNRSDLRQVMPSTLSRVIQASGREKLRVTDALVFSVLRLGAGAFLVRFGQRTVSGPDTL